MGHGLGGGCVHRHRAVSPGGYPAGIARPSACAGASRLRLVGVYRLRRPPARGHVFSGSTPRRRCGGPCRCVGPLPAGRSAAAAGDRIAGHGPHIADPVMVGRSRGLAGRCGDGQGWAHHAGAAEDEGGSRKHVRADRQVSVLGRDRLSQPQTPGWEEGSRDVRVPGRARTIRQGLAGGSEIPVEAMGLWDGWRAEISTAPCRTQSDTASATGFPEG